MMERVWKEFACPALDFVKQFDNSNFEHSSKHQGFTLIDSLEKSQQDWSEISILFRQWETLERTQWFKLEVSIMEMKDENSKLICAQNDHSVHQTAVNSIKPKLMIGSPSSKS